MKIKANKKNLGRLYIILTAVFWALGGVCVKSITWSSMQLLGIRGIISGIVLWLFNGRKKINFTKVNILGGLMMTLTGILFIVANKLTTAGTVIVLEYVAPIFIFLYEVIFRGRKAKSEEIVILLCVFAGCVLAFADNIDMTHMLGNILALLSGVTLATQIVVMTGEGSDSMDCLIIGCIMSVLIGMPFVFFGEPMEFNSTNIIWILIIGLFQYGASNIFFSKGCKLVDDIESSLLLTIEPILNPVFVALIYGEIMGPLAYAGAMVVIISVTLYSLLPAIRSKVTSTGKRK